MLSSMLFQNPSFNTLLTTLLQQCSADKLPHAISTTMLKMLLQNLENTQDKEIKSETKTLIEILINEGILLFRNEKLEMLRFEISSDDTVLVKKIESSLRNIKDSLATQQSRTDTMPEINHH